MEGQAKKRTLSPIVNSSIPNSTPGAAVINIPTTRSSATECPVMRQLLTEASTCGKARKVLFDCALRN